MSKVTVQAGDSMWAIAQRAGVSLKDLIQANPQVENPSLIHPGEELQLPGSTDDFEQPAPPPVDLGSTPAPEAPAEPPPAAPDPAAAPEAAPPANVYTVRSGDTLSGIAARAGVSLAQVLRANPDIRNPSLIFPGQQITIPEGGDVPQSSTPAPSGPTSAAPSPSGDAGANPYYSQFVDAAKKAGVPESWASNPALIELVKHESGFRPDAKNPSSSAFGMFQFLDSTWSSYLPEVPYGSKDPYWQAVGGFRYIEKRYGTPERAWAFWQATVHKDASIAPPDLRSNAQYWIDHDYGGY
ncbi:MAG: LysM peptidoglycan-binding domain-containing protein [Myxococcaceae bacterium]|nr:LysM peptidoglycan-binding domain-containing protein [Myxococcaceae bacterium]